MSRKSDYKSKKIAFLIDTKIQLLNSIEFILSHDLKGYADAYIQMKSKNAEEELSRVKRFGIFREVYSIRLDKNGRLKHIGIFMAQMFPRSYVKAVHHLDLYRQQYDAIFISFATKTFDFLIASSGCRNILGYDDGIGSYMGDPFSDNYKKRYLWFRRFTGHEYRINTVYLNNPSCYRGIEGRNILPIYNILSDEHWKLINTIFVYSHSQLYSDRHIIYLNQAITSLPDYIQKEIKLIDALEKSVSDEYIVRLHPSEKRLKEFSRFKRDQENNMWELLCKDQIDSNYLLIGYFSTAQFMPKFLTGAEPFVIFTFKLFSGLNQETEQRYLELIRFVRAQYRDQSRICIPETMEEYLEDVEVAYKQLRDDSSC